MIPHQLLVIRLLRSVATELLLDADDLSAKDVDSVLLQLGNVLDVEISRHKILTRPDDCDATSLAEEVTTAQDDGLLATYHILWSGPEWRPIVPDQGQGSYLVYGAEYSLRPVNNPLVSSHCKVATAPVDESSVGYVSGSGWLDTEQS